MAKLNYADLTTQSFNSDKPSIGFFSLKNDGDEAIVRFMHNTMEDFELLSVHNCEINGKYRKVNCLRTPSEPTTNCPLCAKGEKISNRIFVNLVEYTRDASGNVVAEPKVWELGAQSYYPQFKNLIDTYGPLSGNIFKVHRNGAKGDMKTTYSMNYLPPANFPESQYPKTDAFANYKVLGTIVIDRPYEDMVTFMQTGSFPAKESKMEAAADEALPFDSPEAQAFMNSQMNYTAPQPMPQVSPQPAYQAAPQTAYGSAPWAEATQVERPARFY